MHWSLQIAATALEREMIVVARTTHDVAPTGVAPMDPSEA